MDNIEIKITWKGGAWQVESDPAAADLPSGFSAAFSITVPTINAPGETLFPAGTTLFLMLADGEESSELAQIFAAFWKQKPFLSSKPTKLLVPIHLNEPLRLRPQPSRKLHECSCRIEGFERTFSSLNQAASWCIDRWTTRQVNAVNVFQAVSFVHLKHLLALHHKREQVRSNTPLPELSDGTLGGPPILPGLGGVFDEQ
jgi:hypothetical protein